MAALKWLWRLLVFISLAFVEDILITTLPAVVAMAVSVLLTIWQGWTWYSIGGLSVGVGLCTAVVLTIVRVSWASRMPITIKHIPDRLPAGIAPVDEVWVHIAVRNNRVSDYFVAQVASIEAAERAKYQTVPWSVKWRDSEDEQRLIVGRTEQLLDLAQARPPKLSDFKSSDSREVWKPGAFRFYSTNPSWQEWMGIEGTTSLDDEYEKTIAVKLRVASIGKDKSTGYSVERTLHLGFNRDFMAEGHVRVTIKK